MTTIADYLDYSPRHSQRAYKEDIMYLHTPRAIVKYAEETTAQKTPEQQMKDYLWWDWGGKITENFLPAVNDTTYSGSRLAYHTRNIAGNKNTGVSTRIEDELAKQEGLMNWLTALKAFSLHGAEIPEVISARTWNGDPTLSNIAHGAAQKFQQENIPQEVKDNIANVATQVHAHTGVPKGSTIYNSSAMAKQFMPFLNKMISDEEAEAYFKGLGWSDEDTKKYVDEYNNAYFKPDVEAHDYENTFYGWFDNPAWRGAARYAAPWLAYGVPLSAIGSMMGNNALWGPTILGALGAGAYGYGVGSGALKDFSESSFGQMLDAIHSTANKPIGAIWNYLDSSTGRVANRILTGKPDYTPPKTKPAAPAPKTNAAATYRSAWGPDNIYVQGQKPYTQAPDLLQIPDFSTPEQTSLEMKT